MKELDIIVLTEDVAADIDGGDLKAGDVGTIVDVLGQGEAFTVEFLTLDGNTAAVATVLPSQARLGTGYDIKHAGGSRGSPGAGNEPGKSPFCEGRDP